MRILHAKVTLFLLLTETLLSAPLSAFVMVFPYRAFLIVRLTSSSLSIFVFSLFSASFFLASRISSICRAFIILLSIWPSLSAFTIASIVIMLSCQGHNELKDFSILDVLRGNIPRHQRKLSPSSCPLASPHPQARLCSMLVYPVLLLYMSSASFV